MVLLFTASDFISITSHIHNWLLFLLWLFLFILSGVISPPSSSSIFGMYQAKEFHLSVLSFLPFSTVHGVLKARIPKWFAISFSSGPHSVRPLHHDPSILGGLTQHGLVSLSFHSFISFIHLHPKVESPIQSAKTRPGVTMAQIMNSLLPNLDLN